MPELFLDGTDDYMEFQIDSTLDFNYSPFTIELWLKGITSGIVLSKADQYDAAASGYSISFGNFYSGAASVSCGILYDNTWHHYVVVATPGTSHKSYRDGKYYSVSGAAGWTGTNNLNLTLGREAGRHLYYYKGYYGMIRIYQKTLNPTEILYNYTHAPYYYLQKGIDPQSISRGLN